MSIQLDGRSVFTKATANIFQAEVIECPDCMFEFSSKHDLDGEEGLYECPLCSEDNLRADNFKLSKVFKDATSLRPAEEWHEDDGNVIWWKLPIEEPPYVGTALDSEFEEGYYTHFTRLIDPLDTSE